MNALVDTYFKDIAAKAEQAVATADGAPADPPPVMDGPQDARATAWTALSVHPLQVLETTYVGVVQDAVAQAGNDQALARENEFEAMTGFFSLSADAPTLLKPSSVPLIDERCRALKAGVASVRGLLAVASDDTYGELASVVENAITLVGEITSTDSVQYAAQGVKDAAAKLGLFQNSAAEALANWKAQNPDNAGQLPAQIDEVETDIVKPLLADSDAVASPRSLYNIEAFYLFRLMHRFVGGDTRRPMDLKSKGIASGAATGAMHPKDWVWLSTWHEQHVALLKTQLDSLGDSLKEKFNVTDDPIRFHLKGGRAMNTALGTPQEGTNDWDTGILINPGLTPKQWYQAFAAVNDLVVTFLDKARFSYTELMNRYAADLTGANLMAALPSPDPDDQKDYTRAGLQAEHLEQQLDAKMLSPQNARIRTLSAVSTFVSEGQGARPAGVNGELIDVGIATRSSVELREHWNEVRIIEAAGISGINIPVPDLAYFIDDFSTIIREAIATQTVDRKLAKRLRRLDLVLNSNDDDLVENLKQRQGRIVPSLPKTFAVIGNSIDNPAGRLKIWLLDEILLSVPSHTQRPDWVAALDTYITGQADTLFSEQAAADLWQELEAAFDTPEEKAAAKALLIVENAASVLSRTIVKDAQAVAAAIGAPDDAGATYWKEVYSLTRAALNVSAPGKSTGFFYLVGGLAARMQTAHAGLPTDKLMAQCPLGIVEIAYRAGQVPASAAIKQLQQMLGNVPGKDLTISLEQNSGDISLVIRTSSTLDDTEIKVKNTTLILIREVRPERAARVVDFVDGWPTSSIRDLARDFEIRAAYAPDYDIRTALKKTAIFLRKDVLGRQLL